MQKVHLISVWPLKDGCPAELIKTLKDMPATIIANEPGTLSYAINIPTQSPLDDSPPELAIVFIETYQDTAAFKAHLYGPLFTKFRKQNLKYFKEDPANPGWAITETTFLNTVASACK